MDYRLLRILTACLLLPACEGILRKSSECKRTLGCISNRELTMMLTWQPAGDRVHFQMRAYIGKGDLYVAMGLSHDEEMGRDSVIECINTGGRVTVLASYNIGKSNERYPEAGLFNKTGFYENGTILCSFSRLTNASADGKRLSLLLPRHVMLVWGPVNTGTGRKMQHQVVSVSSVAVNMQATGDFETERPSLILVKIHGSLMMLAWVMLTSFGIIIARYFKTLLADSTMCSQKVWFQIHRIVMVLALLLTAAGTILIFIHVGGYREPTPDTNLFELLHPIFGLAVMVLCLLNPILALCRPHPDALRRPIFNWVHRSVGTGSHVVAAVTIFLGLKLETAGAPLEMLFTFGGFLLWHIIIEIVFFSELFCAKRKGMRRRAFEVSTIDQGIKNPPQTSSSPQKVTAVEEVLLMMHVAVSIAAIVLLLALFWF